MLRHSKTPAFRVAEVPFAGPDAGAIDFLLSNRASAVVGSFLAVSEQDVKSKEGVVNLEEKVGSGSGVLSCFEASHD